MRLYILNQGALECDKNWIVAMSTYATIDNKAPQPIWTKMPVYSVLIDHPEGKFLFDMGCDRQINNIMKTLGKHHYHSFPYVYSKEQYFENQLKLAGATVDEIKAIVLSHMHYDHVGNLPLFSGKNTVVYVHNNEYKDVFVNNVGIKGFYFDKYLKEPKLNYVTVDQEFKLAEGVTVIPFGSSHTNGLLGLLVELKEGNFIFPSDVCYSKENYGYPIKPTGKVYDTLGTVREIERIHSLEKQYHAKVMFPHDITEFITYKKAPDYYE